METKKVEGFELDVHVVINVGGIEVWISDGSINNWLTNPDVLATLDFKEVYRDWNLAAVFKGKKGWVLFILDGDEWSLEHCYIPDPEGKYTLKQILTVAEELKNK